MLNKRNIKMLFTPRTKGLGGENFLKLNDGEEITGIFKGEIYRFKKHWTNERSIECIGESCSLCRADSEEQDPKKKRYPSFRFRINFITSKDGQWIPKIFEGGGETYDSLTNINSKVDLSKSFVDISRHGVKKNTKYQFFVRSDTPFTKEMAGKIESVSLLPLSSGQQNNENEKSDDLPF